ncbi:MAG: transglycosylase domain-containing protein [Ardenticatenaceae bacterium]|nr:transglycosylase domain-containing protein [Ardenticatenaceae bacterium]
MNSNDETRPINYDHWQDPDATQVTPVIRPQQPRRRWGCLRNCFVLSIIGVALAAFTIAIVTGTVIYVQFSNELEDDIAKISSEAVETRETFETSRIYDRNGEILWEIFGEGKRTYVPIDDIPLVLRQATIAVEDDTFYENEGADIPSLIAALIYNFRNPNARPVGGSTITQQIVRHIAFDYEERTSVSYNRKAKEIILAWIMTRDYSKDEILELYLNEIYYGNLAYGIEAAAQTYFGKAAKDLTVSEATLLAGLPQSPVDLDPLANFDAAKERQWLILNLMVSEGFLSESEITEIYQTPLTFAEQSVSLEAPHFTTWVRQQLEEQLGAETVANGGLRVTTSLDLRYQRLAERLAEQHVAALRGPNNLTNAAMVVMKPGTGEILAMLGSVNYDDEAIDGEVNVTLSLQQPGSSIKPLTYALALTPGADGASWQAGDIVWDVKTTYQQTNGVAYVPVNYDERYHGPMRLRDALANSYNVPAVLVLQDIGVPRFLDFARSLGIESLGNDASRYGLSLTLGGGEVTPLELTSAYAVLANGGQRIPPAAVLKVENSAGEVLFEYQPPAGQQVIDPRVAYVISDILSDDGARVPAMGSGNPLDLPFPAAAKTGTTNDFRDNWTLGYTPGLVVGVWAGNTDNSPMVNVSGLTGAAPLWNSYMNAVYNDFELLNLLGDGQNPPPTEFVQPNVPGLSREALCDISSIVFDAPDCSRSRQEWKIDFSGITEPTPTPQLDEEVVVWEQIEPSVWRIPAVYLPPLSEEEIQLIANDEDALPPMTMCHLPAGTQLIELPPDAAPQVFLEPPRNPESQKEAYKWAFDNGVALLPTASCTEEMLLVRDPNIAAVWRISSPKAGDELDGVLPIVGTADFDPQVVQFYKLELGIPQNGDVNNVQWVTLGETSNIPVVNGQLETLYASGLTPGDYFLRLIVIKWDGNYVGEPYTVPFTIVRE